MDGPLLWIGNEVHAIGWNPYGPAIHSEFNSKSWNLVKDPVLSMSYKMKGRSHDGEPFDPFYWSVVVTTGSMSTLLRPAHGIHWNFQVLIVLGI